jgi:hypothetical protein
MNPAELFSRLFPSGVQMTGEFLADLERSLYSTRWSQAFSA